LNANVKFAEVRGVLPGNSIIKVRQTTQVLSRRQPNET
jgi:hypothetical protein